jgi:hypothetical protein
MIPSGVRIFVCTEPVVSQNQTGTKVSDAGRLAAGEASLYRRDLGA